MLTNASARISRGSNSFGPLELVNNVLERGNHFILARVLFVEAQSQVERLARRLERKDERLGPSRLRFLRIPSKLFARRALAGDIHDQRQNILSVALAD